ncbi:MAG: hypothetical protein ACRDT0_08605 [Pseudonocardiaceae bacterium]
MTEFLFPDNTVLCNFAAVQRLDLLKSVLCGRGRWTEAVEYEATRSAHYVSTLADLFNDCWLGEAIEISADSDIQAVNGIRRAVFGGTDAKPLKHLGEAQTCFVILNWTEFAGSWWISDDQESLRYARRRGITTRETIDLVKTAIATGHVEVGDAFALMLQMATRGRRLRLPDSTADLSC